MGFLIPSLPSFPSMSSLRDILDPSGPQVYYPSTSARPRRPSTSHAPSLPPSRSSTPVQATTQTPTASPAKARAALLPPVPNDWPSTQARGRRLSTSSERVTPGEAPRPAHRRSHSAAPLPACPMPSDADSTGNASTRRRPSMTSRGVTSFQSYSSIPQNRLQEFSRNPLASTSAISLPTLSEADDPAQVGAGCIIPPSARGRKSSLASVITCNSSTYDSPPVSPRRLIVALPGPGSGSSVPPPQVLAGAKAARPPLTPRSWSVVDLSQAQAQAHGRSPGRGLHRHASFTQQRQTHQGHSTSDVSDVEVLATWSFPNHESADHDLLVARGEGGQDLTWTQQRPNSQSLLCDQLLSLANTVQPKPAANDNGAATRQTPMRGGSIRDPDPQPAGSSRRNVPLVETGTGTGIASPGQGHGHGQGHVRPIHRLSHRHSHSSPNLLVTPPTLPRRRTGTTGLRQPNPLSMPWQTEIHVQSRSVGPGSVSQITTSFDAGVPGLGSSPGSLSSESYSSSSAILPSPAASIVSLPGNEARVLGSELRKWTSHDERGPRVSDSRGRKNHGGSEDSEEDEEYIDYDRI